MARILCVWELGTALGHLATLRLPIDIALQLGHEVYLAARELDRIPSIWGHLPITYLQAPFKQIVGTADQSAFPSYTHLLARQCFSGVDELEMNLRAWHALFALVKPDLVLFEHSTTALIASHAFRFKKVLVGNGFFIPPVASLADEPFAPFVTTPQTPKVLAGLRSDDAVLLKVVNLALERLGSPPLAALQDIYNQADEQFLMTLPALDHFGERSGKRYLGIEPPAARAQPKWPTGSGPKVFGYLQAIPSLERLLQDLQVAGVCALLYIRNVPPALKAVYSSENLRFTDELLDLTAVAAQAAWVISHGNHNTVAIFFMAGIPQLLIPRHQEHLFVSMRLVAQGCAVLAFQDQRSYSREIARLVADPDIRRSATEAAALSPSLDALDASGFVRQTLQAMLR